MLAVLAAAVLVVGPAQAIGDPTLSIGFSGTGAGSVASQSPDSAISCASSRPADPACSTTYPEGTAVALLVTPAAGSYFAGWSGGCAGSNYFVSFDMPASDTSCVAEFDDGGGVQGGPVLTVTTSASDGGNLSPTCYVNYCTLVDAVANGSGKTIDFAGGVTTITVGELEVNPASPITIDGGSGVTLSSGGGPILQQDGGTLTLAHLRLTGATSGGINQSAGTLTLQDVNVQGNSRSSGFAFGGGIVANGTLTMTGGTIDGNSSPYCGGIEITGTATLTGVDITNNAAHFAGGGLCVGPQGNATVNGGRIAGNSVSGGPGGGAASADVLTVNGTVFDGNAATSGDALYAGQGGSATATNATFINNVGTWTIANDSSGTINVVNSTVAGNDGGVSGKVTLLNSILAGQGASGNCNPISGSSITSLGHNLDDAGACSFAGPGDLTGDATLAAPNVDGLVKLLNGSPALDTGVSGTVGGLTVPANDAAGTSRPQGGGVDMGAIEMAEHKLTLGVAGTGAGTILRDAPSSPGGWYVAGSTVHLTATPTGNAAFDHWSGDCVGTNATTGVIVNADKTCTATFVAPPTEKTFAPSKGRVGSTVSIVGSGFTGVTTVQFGGHDASFRVVSNTKITAVVPNDAQTGAIHLANVAGTVDTAPFTVTWIAPKPSAIAPAKAGAGFTVTLSGSGFLAASAVTFNGIPAASFTVVKDTQLTAVVPNDAGATGHIAVTTPGGTGQTKGIFTFVLQPTVSSVSPTSGPFGTTVTINGTRFTGALQVTFGLVSAKFKVVSDTTILTTVPLAAVTNPVTVTTMGGTAIGASSFTVTYVTPTVASFSPAKGKVGTKVTITGAHFAGTTSVTFGGHAAAFTLTSDTKLVATVPSGAVSGAVSVTNPAGTGTAAKPFFVG